MRAIYGGLFRKAFDQRGARYFRQSRTICSDLRLRDRAYDTSREMINTVYTGDVDADVSHTIKIEEMPLDLSGIDGDAVQLFTAIETTIQVEIPSLVKMPTICQGYHTVAAPDDTILLPVEFATIEAAGRNFTDAVFIHIF